MSVQPRSAPYTRSSSASTSAGLGNLVERSSQVRRKKGRAADQDPPRLQHESQEAARIRRAPSRGCAKSGRRPRPGPRLGRIGEHPGAPRAFGEQALSPGRCASTRPSDRSPRAKRFLARGRSEPRPPERPPRPRPASAGGRAVGLTGPDMVQTTRHPQEEERGAENRGPQDARDSKVHHRTPSSVRKNSPAGTKSVQRTASLPVES